MTPGAPLPIEVSDEPLVGWRCWFVLPDELLLRPIFKRGLAWKPRQPFEAVCPEKLHEVPHDDVDECRCGIWTVREPRLLDETGWTTAPPKGVGGRLPGILVVGEVALWGKVVEHERGWRASRAYPRHLYAFTDDPMIAETLRERYGVPVEWGADAEALHELLPGKRRTASSPRPTAPPPPVPSNAPPPAASAPSPAAIVTLLRSTISDALRDQGEALRQIIATTQAQQAAERQALSEVVADVKGELRRVLEQAEKFHQQALGIALAHARAGLMPAMRNELAALKEELSRQGITMDQVAAEAGVHRTSVCNVLAGRSTSAAVLAAIAKLLKTETAASCGVDLVARATALGWTQNELARRAGTDASMLSRALRGVITSRPALEDAARVIAEAEQDLRKSNDDPATLKATAKSLGITHVEIAAEATKTSARGRVGIPCVSKTLSGTSKSSNVIAAVQRLIEQAKVRPPAEVEAASREAALKASGHTKADVMRLAGVSERMIYFWYRGEKTGAEVAAAHRALTGVEATSVRKPPVALPQRVGAGHPALAQRLRELGIAQADVAQVVGCSRALVTFVLMGRTAGVRGINTAVVRAAEQLIAQATGGVSSPPPSTMREELQRERAELDALTRRARDERMKSDKARRDAERERRRLAMDRRKLDRATDVHRARVVAVGLRKRLTAAGISQTRLARVAKCDISQVSSVLSGRSSSRHIVATAEKLLAKRKGGG